MKTVDAEVVFNLIEVCDPCTRYHGIGRPFSPRLGLVVATDGWLMVAVNTDCHIPPAGKVPDIAVFEKQIADQQDWKQIDDIITNPQPCLGCGSKRFVYSDIFDVEGESLDLFRRSQCWECNYEIGGTLFSMELCKKLLKHSRPSLFFVKDESQLMVKSESGFGILMARKPSDKTENQK